MKKIYIPLLLTILFVASCQMNQKMVPLDPEKAKAEVTKTLDSITLVLGAKDAKGFMAFLTDDGLFCGPDPTELWDKTTYAKNMIVMMAADTLKPGTIVMDKRVILIDKDGNSAMVMLQFRPEWSNPIPVRNSEHLVRIGKRWMIDYASMVLIPDNKNLGKITAVVK